MTSIINFIPISGSLNNSPPCYLLKIDEFCFLLDCGLDENCDLCYINNLSPYIPNIDAVLLSHPDTFHLGALPYLFGKCSLSCDVYATTPVYQMGQMFAYDLYQSHQNYENFDLFCLDDVDLAFEKVIQVKYNQTIALKDKGQGITLTPLPAGHMIGGTIWKIVKDGEEDIVYASDINHKKERHLNGCALDRISRPSMLIIDCSNINYVPERRKKRDSQLFGSIVETLRNFGSVLIGTDTAGRILELSHMLDQFWRSEPGLQAYSIVLLNNFSYNVFEFAKSLVEWMSDKLMRGFEGQRNNPFAFKHIQLCHNLIELKRVNEPMVVLASQPDFECVSLIVFNKLNHNETFCLDLERKSRLELFGEELEQYQEQKREEEARKEQEKLLEGEMKKKIKEEEEESEESDDDEFYFISNEINNERNTNKFDEKNVRSSLKKQSINRHDLMLSSRYNDGRVKGGGFFKNAKKSYPMYPDCERKIRWDEYGEIIDPDDFSIFDSSRIFMEDKENIVNNDEQMIDVNEQNGKINSNLTKSITVEPAVPTKCVTSIERVSVEARIEFIDFEGRSDGESIKKLIKMIRPHRCILIRTNDLESAESFVNYCRTNDCVTSGKIFVPKILELIDATTERHIYQVRLKDALVSSLRFSSYKDGAELAWVEGEIEMNLSESILPQHEEIASTAMATIAENENENAMENVKNIEPKEDQKQSNRSSIPILKQLQFSKITPHQTIFVNELKLSDFKQILMKHGIQAEFSGGVLLCKGQVEVKRTESGRIQLEGTVSDDYFKVRKLLYEQYAIL
ncbi:Cleavage and polyadenylation specificity factor subunit 2 [Sarcoptes scabiei]|uniref:Cleavage and polyadenylation specificity factor subunit 2 n=1 Tax=Sarcoptes scabiei TaxID=52283 RepID=A0A834RGH3_SARSC|nr:Cleavage and polyadenylation specificity factor subunit 2 [Sarcoptes scabiei]